MITEVSTENEDLADLEDILYNLNRKERQASFVRTTEAHALILQAKIDYVRKLSSTRM